MTSHTFTNLELQGLLKKDLVVLTFKKKSGELKTYLATRNSEFIYLSMMFHDKYINQNSANVDTTHRASRTSSAENAEVIKFFVPHIFAWRSCRIQNIVSVDVMSAPGAVEYLIRNTGYRSSDEVEAIYHECLGTWYHTHRPGVISSRSEPISLAGKSMFDVLASSILIKYNNEWIRIRPVVEHITDDTVLSQIILEAQHG